MGVRCRSGASPPRLLDFFSNRTAWQRTLWTSGTILSLSELLEASEQVANGIVSQPSMGNFAHSIDITAGRDHGTRWTRMQAFSIQSSLVSLW
jgi:hypothetical protein